MICIFMIETPKECRSELPPCETSCSASMLGLQSVSPSRLLDVLKVSGSWLTNLSPTLIACLILLL